MQKLLIAASSAASTAVLVGSVHAQYANAVVEYQPGTTAGGFTDASAALGSPSRTTEEGGATTPFYAVSDPTRVVTIGEGGSLTVAFAAPILDNPSSVQFGVDLLVFGNAFFYQSDFGTPANPTADAIFAEGGNVEVSADGVNFFPVTGVADGAFPTLGYSDVSPLLDQNFDGIDLPAGAVETDFTKAVDPNYDWVGQTASEIIAAYDGSGGGVPIDFSSTGLPFVNFVRVTNPVGSGVSPEIDGFADVIPEPSALGLALGALFLRRKR